MKRMAAGARLAALAGVVIISFSAILVRQAGVAPITAAFFRTAYAAPALLLLALLLRRPGPRLMRLRWLAFGAGAALACDLYMWHQAIVKIGAGLATVVANVQVPFVGLAAWLIYRERPHARAFVAVPLVFLGVILISGLRTSGAYGLDPVGGTFLGVGAGVIYAAFLLMFRASGKDGAHPAVPLCEATLAAAVTSFVIGQFDGSLDLAITWPAHGWLLTLSLGCSVLGWILITHAITRLPALETSVMLMLQPMLTMLWAAPLFGEWISALQWTGVALVMGGVGYLSIRGAVSAEQGEAAPSPGGPPPGTGPLPSPTSGPAVDCETA